MRSKADTVVFSLVKRAVVIAALCAAVATAAAAALQRTDAIVSIISGAVIAIVSFVVLVMVIMRTFGEAIGSGMLRRWPLAGVFMAGSLKLLVLGAILWWLISTGRVQPLAFLAGFSTMVVALIIEGLRTKGQQRQQ